ncbi:MAG: putative ABC transporter permease, partial [Anaerotardibacter sp.]
LALNVVSLTCEMMLFGASFGSISDNLILAAAQIALSSYLNPSLAREQMLKRELRKLDNQTHYRLGTLGLADPGKGFIRLDFFNVFWTFIVASFLGLLVEIAFHMIVVDPGVYQDRAGILFGPFSPIYGVGAVLMTIALNRIKECNLVIIFVVCTIIGGSFEFFVSWFMETAFGAVAWDYHGEFLGDLLGGRTCLKFASMFGILGCVWIKIFLPALLKLINKIPLGLRYGGTILCAALMLVNALMTFQALDNWSERLAGNEPSTPVEKFYAETFDDEFMAKRFESMTINPENSVRA